MANAILRIGLKGLNMNTDQAYRPTQIVVECSGGITYLLERRRMKLSGGSDAASFVYHYCCLPDGTAVSWLGANHYQLPDGTTVRTASPRPSSIKLQ
jgi:hypothetical protein